MGTLVNIDKKIMEPGQASISVFDRGFLYGDSVYEVIRTYNGKPFETYVHLERLINSAKLIALSVPWDIHLLENEIIRTVEAADNLKDLKETYIRLMVTRGTGDIGLDPALARNPCMVIIVRPLVIPPLEFYRKGVEVAVVTVQRTSQAAVNPSAKTGNYLNNLLGLKEARDRGAYEALMLDSRGRITEGSTSNFFIIRNKQVLTPPSEAGILEGVTRKLVMSLACGDGISCIETHLEPDDILKADEAFITSTIREILPVTKCNGQNIGNGKTGPVTRRIQEGFRSITGKPVDGGGF